MTDVPPPYQQFHGYVPPPGQRQIRPRAWWIAVVWLVALLTAVSGFVGFSADLHSTLKEVAPAKAFAPGELVTMPIDPAVEPGLYLASRQPVHYSCAVAGGDLSEPTGTQTVDVWELVEVIDVPEKGEYEVYCTIDEDAVTDVRFGIGRQLSAATGEIVGNVVVLVTVPGAGVLFAIIMTIAILVRRSYARRRIDLLRSPHVRA
ncbi:hypothetical protein ACFXJ8_09475 [Nonomuraea sp. NPDC059194]|uniref:hypothetical protein n=1 Tax=Nonomuraea sp. NPDC059194 TaxID=3346764 RepID=UPI0036A012AC